MVQMPQMSGDLPATYPMRDMSIAPPPSHLCPRPCNEPGCLVLSTIPLGSASFPAHGPLRNLSARMYRIDPEPGTGTS